MLDELVARTNGRQVRPDQLEELRTKLTIGLRNSYVLGFISSNSARDGTYRQIRVKVQPPAGITALTVRSGAGYHALWR